LSTPSVNAENQHSFIHPKSVSGGRFLGQECGFTRKSADRNYLRNPDRLTNPLKTPKDG
jgi:hypothetical protein